MNEVKWLDISVTIPGDSVLKYGGVQVFGPDHGVQFVLRDSTYYLGNSYGGIVFIFDCSIPNSIDVDIASYPRSKIKFIEKFTSLDIHVQRSAWDEKIDGEIDESGYDSTIGYWRLVVTPTYIVYGYSMVKNNEKRVIADAMVESIKSSIRSSKLLPRERNP
ncbi:MAG: hypothetical protein JNL32_07090 [Candidatus Kapabacteria bacterium]|nr:hypothetical protein [Candidatus Kapabacteria bacterium]